MAPSDNGATNTGFRMMTGIHFSCVWASSGGVPLGQVPGCRDRQPGAASTREHREDLSHENVQAGTDFWREEPGAGFQAGQVQADSHLAQLPGGPRGLTHREALEVTLGLSLGPANHRPLRGQFPTARAQVWREVPEDLGQASRKKPETVQCPWAQSGSGA